MSSLTQACAALVEALLDDPFYVAITEGLGNDPGARRRALTPYFQYSLEEAQRTGTGAGESQGFNLPAAGQTGSSHDGWFAGFTSNLLCPDHQIHRVLTTSGHNPLGL